MLREFIDTNSILNGISPFQRAPVHIFFSLEHQQLVTKLENCRRFKTDKTKQKNAIVIFSMKMHFTMITWSFSLELAKTPMDFSQNLCYKTFYFRYCIGLYTFNAWCPLKCHTHLTKDTRCSRGLRTSCKFLFKQNIFSITLSYCGSVTSYQRSSWAEGKVTKNTHLRQLCNKKILPRFWWVSFAVVRFDTDGLILVQSRGFVTFINLGTTKADLVTAVCVILVSRRISQKLWIKQCSYLIWWWCKK